MWMCRIERHATDPARNHLRRATTAVAAVGRELLRVDGDVTIVRAFIIHHPLPVRPAVAVAGMFDVVDLRTEALVENRMCRRSEERRVGKEDVSTRRYRWS